MERHVNVGWSDLDCSHGTYFIVTGRIGQRIIYVSPYYYLNMYFDDQIPPT
jgi:hypothetical protein